MKTSLKIGNRGMSFLEVMIAMIILSLVMLSVARSFLFMNRRSVDTQERAFAAQKAIQMMEELRGLISNTNAASIGVLDDYDDGALTRPVLTTRQDITDPADFLSGNPNRKYVRRVSVIRLPNEPLARRVYVRVFRASDMTPLAETVSILRTISNQYASSQVFDVFVISIENVPGWWVSLSSMKPMFDNVIQDLQTRNPGLEWRTHWITRLSYGRDPHYTPYINEAVKTNAAAPPSVYFYPGSMDKPSVGTFLYYVPSFFLGRINVDGSFVNASKYSVADQYNHAVRWPEELDRYGAAVAQAASNGEATPEMSLRMLLETMNDPNGGLKNAMIVNLHGELLPLPPIRNYSDPAKSPEFFPNVRVVSHPAKLEYGSGDEVKLRVYPYVTNPDSWAGGATLSTMTVRLPAVELAPSQISIRKMAGNDTVVYGWQAASSGSDYTVTNPSTGTTLITLYGTPLRHPQNGSNGGLPSSDRLYGLEYIPCHIGAYPDFAEGLMDLAWHSTTRPKNTARWVITFSSGAIPDGTAAFETRIGDDYTVGGATQPTNVSRTYAWVGVDAPATERYQFMGDPRHMPYVDVKDDHGYNWYFRSINAGDYEGFGNATNGWNGTNNIDVPRFFQLYRNGLMTSAAVYTSMTGFSNYYVGIGGEMGYDASNGFSSGLPIRRTPWDPDSTSTVGVDEITDAQTEPYARLISNADDTWWGLHWLGELYPDSEYAAWALGGNLPVGPGNYYRARYSSKGFSYNPHKRTGERAAASFFNGNPTATGNNVFSHEYYDANTAAVTTAGLQLAQDFNFPLLGSMTAARPFRLNHNDNGRRPPEWNSTSYSGVRTTLNVLESYYEPSGYSGTHDSSALVRVSLGSNHGNAIMNGLSPQTNFGAAQISKLCAIDLVRGFMALGAPAITDDRVPQVPLVAISSPSATDEFVNPTSITVDWGASWTRWDGRGYTESYPANYTEATGLTYNVKVSNNNGTTWTHIQDGSAATAGDRNDAYAAAAPLNWNVSALPEGSYIVRVEGFRDARDLHYTYHQRQIYIFR